MCRHPHIAEQCLSCRRLTCLSAQHFTLLADAADGGCSLTADEMFQRLAALMSSPTAGGGAVDDLAVRMCLHGVPAEHRPVLWPLLSGAGRARAAHPAGFYARLCGERVDAAVSAEIAKDFGRCYPDEPGFGRSGEGTRVLGRVLHAFAAMEPKVGYTQGMAFLVGLLLMEGLAEEDAFWVFVSLVSNKRWDMRAIYAPELDRAGWNSRCRDMLHVTARRVPGLVHWARLTNTEAEALLLPFIPSVFANRLPRDISARVLDAFLAVGWPALHSLLGTLLAHAWIAAPAGSCRSDSDAGMILPAVYKQCGGADAGLLRAAWRELLPHPRRAAPRQP